MPRLVSSSGSKTAPGPILARTASEHLQPMTTAQPTAGAGRPALATARSAGLLAAGCAPPGRDATKSASTFAWAALSIRPIVRIARPRGQSLGVRSRDWLACPPDTGGNAQITGSGPEGAADAEGLPRRRSRDVPRGARPVLFGHHGDHRARS